MKRWIKYAVVVCVLLAMVMPASMACGGGSGAETPKEAVEKFLDAYEDKDAAEMLKYEDATLGGLNKDERKATYEASFDLITSISVTGRSVTKVSETDTTATYKATYSVTMTVSGVEATQSEEYDITLKKDGGWVITTALYGTLFT